MNVVPASVPVKTPSSSFKKRPFIANTFKEKEFMIILLEVPMFTYGRGGGGGVSFKKKANEWNHSLNNNLGNLLSKM